VTACVTDRTSTFDALGTVVCNSIFAVSLLRAACTVPVLGTNALDGWIDRSIDG